MRTSEAASRDETALAAASPGKRLAEALHAAGSRTQVVAAGHLDLSTVTTSRWVSGWSMQGGENKAPGACWLSAGKGVVWAVADPAGRTSASEPKATEARPRRGAELGAMIETRGA